MFSFEMLLYAFVILFLHFLKCVYIVLIEFQLIVLVTFSFLFRIKASAK